MSTLTRSALSKMNAQQPTRGGNPSPAASSGINSDADTDIETMSNAPSSTSGHSIEIGGTTAEVRRLREDPQTNRMRDVLQRGRERTAAINTAVASAVAKERREDPLDGARSYCSMCNINPSEYLCNHCGRLSFCTKCCLNLHDNKYLSGHIFQILDSIPQGEQCGLDEIKKKKATREEEERAGRRLLQSSTILRPTSDASPLLAANNNNSNNTMNASAIKRSANKSSSSASLMKTSAGDTSSGIDMASLTADKSVILVRLRELGTCLESGQQLHRELANERNTTKETTATAVEAVRRRFDVLRQLINAKEADFVAVVEQAGKERFDLATAATCSINIATSELDGFISHMSLQMDRLEENKPQFNVQRHGMLDSTLSTLTAVDGWTHDHQTRLQEIRSMSLGVHVPIDVAAEAIQSITPPKYLSYRGTEEGKKEILSIKEAATVPVGEIVSPRQQSRSHSAIPVAKFVDTPGVKVIVQTQVKRVPSSSPAGGLNSTVVLSSSVLGSSRAQSPIRSDIVSGRKLHTVEQQELRNTPMREVVRPKWKDEQQQQSTASLQHTAAGKPLNSGEAAGTQRQIRRPSPLRGGGGVAANNHSIISNVSAIHRDTSSIHIPTAGPLHSGGGAAAGGLNNSRSGTPTRRVAYGVSDGNTTSYVQSSGASNGLNGAGVGRPNVSRSSSAVALGPNSSRYALPADPYAQRVVSSAVKTHHARALSPNNSVSQRFTTSPHSRTGSPVTMRPSTGTSSFALPTQSVRRGGSPLRNAAGTANTVGGGAVRASASSSSASGLVGRAPGSPLRR